MAGVCVRDACDSPGSTHEHPAVVTAAERACVRARALAQSGRKTKIRRGFSFPKNISPLYCARYVQRTRGCGTIYNFFRGGGRLRGAVPTSPCPGQVFVVVNAIFFRPNLSSRVFPHEKPARDHITNTCTRQVAAAGAAETPTIQCISLCRGVFLKRVTESRIVYCARACVFAHRGCSDLSGVRTGHTC